MPTRGADRVALEVFLFLLSFGLRLIRLGRRLSA